MVYFLGSQAFLSRMRLSSIPDEMRKKKLLRGTEWRTEEWEKGEDVLFSVLSPSIFLFLFIYCVPVHTFIVLFDNTRCYCHTTIAIPARTLSTEP